MKFKTVDNNNYIVRVMEVKEAVRRIREHNRIHQSAEPRNSPIITEILESCARLLEDIDAGKLRYVKYGQWDGYVCSECNTCVDYFISGYDFDFDEKPNFCPNCGALMKRG